VVFATDAPLGPIAKTVKVIDELDLDQTARARIMDGNALALLKMGAN
jgi:predicted TIM-barrel fold metal-dependent hydrolase